MITELYPAIKAFINFQGKILILRESMVYEKSPNKGKYDVPGGKVKPGESFEDGLLREITEETGLEVKIGKAFHVGEWRPIVNGEKINHIIGTFVECFAETDQVTLCKDHDKYEWIIPSEYEMYNLIESNKQAFKSYLNK